MDKEYVEREAVLVEVEPKYRPFLAERINKIPAADVALVRRGKWTLNKDGSGTCSECGRRQEACWDLDGWDNFCHHCGCDMRIT